MVVHRNGRIGKLHDYWRYIFSIEKFLTLSERIENSRNMDALPRRQRSSPLVCTYLSVENGVLGNRDQMLNLAVLGHLLRWRNVS